MEFILAVPELDTMLVHDVCWALARYNARTWTCVPTEVCTVPPWSLRYERPGAQSVVRLRDAIALVRDGRGGCGELAAAYAGFALARGVADVQLHVAQQAPTTWHVWAAINGRTYDPAVVGR